MREIRFVFDMYVNEITSPITNFCLIPSLFKLQEFRQQAKESGRKHMEMTDMLKVAEAKAVDVIVKKGAKSKKQSKIPTKASKIPKDPIVTKKTNKKRNSRNNRSSMTSKIMST